MGLGSSKPSLEEQLRSNKREINKSVRELDRERNKLTEEEKKLVYDIKQTAQRGDMHSTRMMARNLVRTRKHIQKFYEMRSQLQAVGLTLQTVKSTKCLAESMRAVAQVMVGVNKLTNIPELQKTMANFIRENEKLGLTEEMMADVVDDAMGSMNDEEEEENVVNQVLEEIGVDLSGQLLEAPSGAKISAAKQQRQGPQAIAVDTDTRIPVQQMKTTDDTNEFVKAKESSSAANTTAKVSSTDGAASSSNTKVCDLEKSLQQRVNNLKKT